MHKNVYSVSRLLGEVVDLLEDNYRSIWVEGEISGLAKPASGHRYFSLKDGDSLIRCVWFKHAQRHSDSPAEGMQVLLRGRISVYTARGDLQLIVDHLEDAGEGALRRAFEEMKRKLAAEGLFAAAHKQPLPPYPTTIGIVSSPHGAVLHDIRVTLNRRYPLARLIVYPTAVQGASAVGGIVAMLKVANTRREVDVLILARGGGSLIDLQAFNEEAVARAIFASELPVVSAIGHEIDFTIADLVADLRAATPTAAAETLAPDIAQLRAAVQRATHAVRTHLSRRVATAAQTLDHAAARLVHPLQRIQSATLRMRALSGALGWVAGRELDQHRHRAAHQTTALRYASPAARIAHHQDALATTCGQLRRAVAAALTAHAHALGHLTGNLKLISPDHTLARGYAILQDQQQTVLSDASQTHTGQRLTARLARGSLVCEVKRVVADKEDG